jgi:DNA-binding MarR family transcriptional regulator
MRTRLTMERQALLDAAIYLKRVQQSENTAVDAALAPLDLSLSLWCALERIAKNPGSSTHDLAALTCLTDQSFSALVAKLAERGLVERTQGGGRVIRHRLTEEGEKALAGATPILADTLAAEFSPLEPDELDTLVALLKKVSRT